jgi:hypothetical protein
VSLFEPTNRFVSQRWDYADKDDPYSWEETAPRVLPA